MCLCVLNREIDIGESARWNLMKGTHYPLIIESGYSRCPTLSWRGWLYAPSPLHQEWERSPLTDSNGTSSSQLAPREFVWNSVCFPSVISRVVKTFDGMIPTLFFSFIVVLIDANQHFEFGIISHQTQWHIHCPQNHTPTIVRPPFNDRSLTRYQCPSSSQLIHIIPIEVDFTFLCRSSSRLLWIIVDLYQYNARLAAFQAHEMIISIRLNGQMSWNDSKSEINQYQNRSVLINAFYIPFESMDRLHSQPIEIQVDIQHTNRSTRCSFVLHDTLTWTTFIEDYCHTDQSRTLLVPLARCDFFPRFQTWWFSFSQTPVFSSV